MLGCALWVGAWLCGRAPADDTIDALARLAPDAPGAPLLEGLRAVGADRSWLLLARPGRTLGWPRDATGVPEPALLLCRGEAPVALLRTRPAGWLLEPVAGASVGPLAARALSPRAAARALSAALAAGADQLERLDLARPAERASDRRWQEALHPHPVGVDPDALQALTRVALVLDALELALGAHGAAVTAGEAHARARALTDVRDAVEEVACGLVGGQYGLPGTVGP
jgi:hypothetical protein